MLTWIVYDISKNKTRKKVSDKAIAEGLYRVQNSVFLGNINNNQIDEIVIFCDNLINEETDSVYIFPMCQEDFRKVELIGQAFNKAMVNNELKSFFV
jgi:CRISPR-associated protein Cas2